MFAAKYTLFILILATINLTIMFNKSLSLQATDPEIAQIITQEEMRQETHIELIASENYTSPQVMLAQGSYFTNKYAEGYPRKRYYGGCQFADDVEDLAIARAKELFNADFANVQAHSGSSANMAVYHAVLKPHDTVLGMSLAHGGHLTHGATVNFSGQLYNSVQYGIDEQGLLNYDEIAQLAQQHRPKMIVAGFSSYSRVIDWQIFRDIADSVGAVLLVDMAHVAGLVAAGLYPSPVQIADVTTTTTHKTLRGPRGGLILAKSNPELEKKINSRIFPGIQGGPLMHVIAAKAVCFAEAMRPEFTDYQKQVVVNAQAMAKVLIERGFEIISNGTDNHLLLVSFIKQGLTGKDVDRWLGEAHITVNKNAVPNDPQSPFVTSGIRIGTPAVTTRGFVKDDCIQLAHWMSDVIDAQGEESVKKAIQEKVGKICQRLPVYKD